MSYLLLISVVEHTLQVVEDVLDGLVGSDCILLHTRVDVSSGLSSTANAQVRKLMGSRRVMVLVQQ